MVTAGIALAVTITIMCRLTVRPIQLSFTDSQPPSLVWFGGVNTALQYNTIQYSFIRSCQNAATYNDIEREKYVENENVKMVHNE